MTDDTFFDTDCLSAFLWTNDTDILRALYCGKMVLPGPVYQELSNPSIPHIKKRADRLLGDGVAFIEQIGIDTAEYRLYDSLVKGHNGQKRIGRGEAAGIALAKTRNGILASNNYRDILPYIKKYGIRHIDTGCILKAALGQKLITEAEGNTIWQKMLDKNRILPADTFSEYLKGIPF